MTMRKILQLLIVFGSIETGISWLFQDKPPKQVYQYNICNGLSNQLLYHAGHIARAAQEERPVEIPDHFIVNGVQTSDSNVLPTANNSVPFSTAFDKAAFLEAVESLGIQARFVSVVDKSIPCQGMASLVGAKPETVLYILKAFQPSQKIQTIVRTVQDNFKSRDLSRGICLHHRDGQDWYDHCARWESIADGVYRGNCRGVPGRSFLESLEDRGLTKQNWIYYCGDHEIPIELEESGYDFLSRSLLLKPADVKAIKKNFPNTPIRDMWALIDFFVCEQLPHFIGNSVSTFSAVQIALREGEGSFWYNSQSIPLSTIWPVYQIPIVYTYTEQSKSSGKHLLQASIASVQMHMPRTKIHILYNGKKDSQFRNWLTEKGVILHDHEPTWAYYIEQMRLHGDPKTSHLFAHSGNYFGTWQRIDIPLNIESEYCLLLDADTLIIRPFTLADFGLDLTYGIAMSSEMNIEDKVPSNAGVTLMNIPYLKQSYTDFLAFIKQHVTTAKFDHPSPSDQGAYLDFYRSSARFLSPRFNFKPYWRKRLSSVKDPFILHFHGAKPHDYLKYIVGQECDPAIQFLCEQIPDCRPFQVFARASKSVDPFAYCESSFDQAAYVFFCNNILDALVAEEGDCHDLSALVRQELHRVPARYHLPVDIIEARLGRRELRKTIRLLMIASAIGWCLLVVAAIRWKGQRLQVLGLLVIAWAVITFTMAHWHLKNTNLKGFIFGLKGAF